MDAKRVFEKGEIHNMVINAGGSGRRMGAFLTLAGQLLVILCIQSVLEALASAKRQNQMQKTISLGCYLASLVLVLRFMEQYLFEILRAIYAAF